MTTLRRPLAVAAVAVATAFGLAACSSDPYIHSPELIDRQHPEFGVERTDRAVFTVCYAKWQTTAAAVRDLARQECGRYDKRATFVDETFTTCPLAAPAGATYACLGDKDTVADVLSRDRRRRAEIERQLERVRDEDPATSGDSGWSSTPTEPFQ